eukprot:3602581-Pyramimonas_sp.AAC.1
MHAFFQAEDLTLADKSAVLCSSHRVARQVSARLKKIGIPIKPVLQAAYLGVDQGVGRRPARATRRQR